MKPLFLCGGAAPAASETITASGGPPRDAVYSWQSGSTTTVSLAPSGGGLCANSTQCNTVATAGQAGQTTATVTITCTTTGATDSDTVDISVVEVDSLAVMNATATASDPDCYVTTNDPPPNDVKITATLQPNVAPADLPAGFLTWMGGRAGSNALERLVSRGAAAAEMVGLTCGGPSEQVEIHVVDADPLPAANPAVNLVHTNGGAANTGGNFGLTVITIGQQGVVGPDFDITPYLDGNIWRFRVDEIRHSYLIGTNSQGRMDISGPGDPDITQATLCPIIVDLTPPGPGATHGPPRSTYWSQTITQAHEQCHVDRFYTNAAFWPNFMGQFETQVEAETVNFDCSDPNTVTAAAVIAAQQARWRMDIDNFHNMADQAEIPTSEAACHGVSNPMYTALINSIRDTVVPLTPTGLAGVGLSTTSIRLSWASTACNETGFRIERRQGTAAFATAGTVGRNATTFTDTGLARGTTYSYRVIATGVAGDSGPSNIATASTNP